MEKKLKVSDFADLVGCTPKTVYKMIERNELNTVTEKVNFRETTVIVTSDKQLEELQRQFGKLPVNDIQCNETVTENDRNEQVKTVNSNELIEKIIEITRDYTENIKSYNDELITYKSQVLLLEDKQKAEKESLEHWQQEYYQKDSELKTVQRSKVTVIVVLVSVIVVLLLLLLTTGLLLGFEKQKHNNGNILTEEQTVIEQPVTVSNPQTAPPIQKQQPKSKTTPKKK